MNLCRSFLAALLATAFSTPAFPQAPAPAAAPAPATPAAPPPLAAPAPPPAPGLTQPLNPDLNAFLPFKNGSFELPAVQKRTLETEGGNPAGHEESDWAHFIRRKGQGEGALSIGATNEIARTGKQSIFVDFAAITGKRFTASLMTRLIPVKPKHPYKVGMWGRTDKERPLTLDQRRPYLRMEFEFYQEDEETQVGDSDFRVIRIPGSLKRLLFTSSEWNEAYGIARAPEGAAVMKVSFVFNIPNSPGRTDGTIFFDDASVMELPLDFPIQASDEISDEPDDAEDLGATAEQPVGTPPPAGQPGATPPPVPLQQK
jgi:hypothetical protein